MLRKKPANKGPGKGSPPTRSATSRLINQNSSVHDLFARRYPTDYRDTSAMLFGDESVDSSRFMTPQLKHKSKSTAKLIEQPQRLKTATGGTTLLNRTGQSFPMSSTGAPKSSKPVERFRPSVGTALALKTKGSQNFLLMRF